MLERLTACDFPTVAAHEDHPLAKAKVYQQDSTTVLPLTVTVQTLS